MHLKKRLGEDRRLRRSTHNPRVRNTYLTIVATISPEINSWPHYTFKF